MTKQHAPGVISVRLRRSVGSDTKYLTLMITTDRAAVRGWLLIPEVRSFTETQLVDQYLVGSPSAEVHHVVKRYTGSPLPAVQAAPA